MLHQRRHAALTVTLVLAMPALTLAAEGPKGHTHKTFNAGVPGDAKKPFRVVEVLASEAETGGMAFEPARIVVEQNEQIRFVIKNVGKMDHEFMLDSFAANKKHAIAMQKNPEMEHDDPNGKRIAPKAQADMVWKFTKLGTFEYACLIQFHYEAGMKGVVEVVAKGKRPKATAAAKPN